MHRTILASRAFFIGPEARAKTGDARLFGQARRRGRLIAVNVTSSEGMLEDVIQR